MSEGKSKKPKARKPRGKSVKWSLDYKKIYGKKKKK